ncbi:hypothetical protein LEP1GSC016_4139 [Leptospira borgpetersenii serovar Hardjo-bovis str. Sponselee]|uniref:Uncharacterized protein n=1 Tax=Leptospira borgpetersenii serovar Hardjo-bovis str. Sponselee TaxID=1303729 RepID=M6C1J8_LEPBO|nr:hypothetical protein LEP1GSC016_4139 [Leptospira borgpetersenii serovar Hardjo-bovis str. Sponselee]
MMSISLSVFCKYSIGNSLSNRFKIEYLLGKNSVNEKI